MPVKIPNSLPASKILANENIFVMHEERALAQDIRPLKIAILNLMPTKQETETQLLRVLGNTPLQVDPIFLTTDTYVPKNTDPHYIDTFYRTFDEIKNMRFDGLIVTGAPIEHIAFEDVDYWEELVKVMDWAEDNVFSSLYICWSAQAALYYKYGIPKRDLDEKCFGIYKHRVLKKHTKLLRGFDDIFNAPHSRHTEVKKEDIEKHDELMVLAESPEAGVYLASDENFANVFVTGHSEYDADTLEKEYLRDLDKGQNPSIPVNYFPGGDIAKTPLVTWRAHSNLLFGNWLNYCVYQETPFDFTY